MSIDKRILAGFVIILIIVFAAGIKYAEFKQIRSADAEKLSLNIVQEEPGDNLEEMDIEAAAEPEIKAYITGAVKNPGVYTLPAAARVFEAIELACPREDAELIYVEMARILQDEETIYVPSQGEIDAGQVPQFYSAAASNKKGQININRATAEELAANLNGIGPTLAQRIIDYRENNGAFQSIEEIKNVSGIGDKRYEDIKDKIVVR